MELETKIHFAGEGQQQFSSQSGFQLWEAGNWGRRQFGNPKEGESPTLKAATKQRLVKTYRTLWVL
jgi:hypothetical protein